MSTTRRLGRLAALLLAGSLAFTACARGDNDGDTGTTGGENTPGTPDDHFKRGYYEKEAGGTPVQGGQLTFADFAENRNMDPSKTIATGFSGASPMVAVYDQLVRWNTQLNDFEPRLAESVEPNDDHSVWTVKLRDAKFSDGTPVNADAVIGSMNYYMSQKGYDLSVVGPMWKGIKKVDDKTVEIELQGSWTTFPHMLGQGMGFIVAPAAIAGGAEGFKPIGAGAFTFESYKPTEEMVLKANPDYWDGKPYLDSLRFIWLPTDEARVDTVDNGAAQVGLSQNAEIIWNLRDKEKSGALELINQNAILMINNAEGKPGANEKVRQAIGHAIDVQTITDRANNGKGMPSTALFGPWSHWDSGVTTLNLDPEKAKTLLEEAKAEGFDGNLEITGLQTSLDTILTIVGNLEAVGFTVKQDIAQNVVDYTRKIFIEKNYEIGTAGLGVAEFDPYQRLYGSLHSQSFANVLGVKDPELDSLIEELRATEGDDRAPVLKKIDERYQEVAPAVTLAAGAQFIYWNDNVHGVVSGSTGLASFEKAWIQP